VELAAGQPWLVNALAREVVDKLRVVRTDDMALMERSSQY
jgi:hypothetical protein